MSYKNINSCIHNFGHSFVSLMNWEDGEYIDDILKRRVDENPEGTVIIDFINGTILPSNFKSKKLETSAKYYRERWPDHVARHLIAPHKIVRCELRFSKEGERYRVEVFAIDDRGREHCRRIKYS